MRDFEVIHRGRDASGSYLYEIRENGRKVADIQHNHKGEEYFIRRSSLHEWREFDDVLEGGGPEPLRISASGVDRLSVFLAENPLV